jgi:tRNA dimethylallyltransferase
VSTAALHRAVFLTGPTASGKTACGIALARRLDAEIVAVDSMTLYRGLDVGTAKPTLEERSGVPHHLIDVLDPWQAASVADYLSWAARTCEQVKSRGKRALFVGGTPLYLKALLRGLFEGPEAEPDLRSRLEAEAERSGNASLHGRLTRLDPATATRLHPNDRRRIIRALEVLELTGVPLSELQRQHDRPASGVRVFALSRPRAELHRRIEGRVVAMFEGGLVEEVRGLLDGPRPPHDVPMQGIGYREVRDHLNGLMNVQETISRTQARTRQFAKRQETWFRGLAEVIPFPVASDEHPEAIADRLVMALEGNPVAGPL